MGVMECARRGCPNILCDRANSEYGYICNSCFEELVWLGPGTDIEKFLDTPYQNHNIQEEASRAYYDKIFPLNRGGD